MADKTLFSLDDILSHITGKAKQAAAELKEVSTLLAQLQKAGNTLATSDPGRMMNNAFDTAGKYGKSVTAYLSSVLEASRMGLENAEGFAELSLALQSACDISADLAGQYLLAADQAFAMNGSMKELTATLDGACSLADRHALSMTALAEGMSAASTQAAASGMDIRETTAALAALLAATDLSGTEAGNALAGLLMYLQQITGELNGAASLAGPMQLLKELSEANTALDGTDTKRTTLFDAINDTPFQSEALDALLQNYGLYEEMLQDYADGTGTLAANATKAADTWEGSLNRLSNKWTDTIEKLTDSKSIAAAIDHLSGLLAVIDSLTDTLGSLNTLSLLGGGLLGAKNLG